MRGDGSCRDRVFRDYEEHEGEGYGDEAAMASGFGWHAEEEPRKE
jgi:hypothetical protein